MDSIFFAYLTVGTLPSYFEFLFLINYCVVCLRINSKPGLLHENCHIFLKQSNILSNSEFYLNPIASHYLSPFEIASETLLIVHIYICICIHIPLLFHDRFLFLYLIAVSWRTPFSFHFMFLLLFHGGLLFTYH